MWKPVRSALLKPMASVAVTGSKTTVEIIVVFLICFRDFLLLNIKYQVSDETSFYFAFFCWNAKSEILVGTL